MGGRGIRLFATRCAHRDARSRVFLPMRRRTSASADRACYATRVESQATEGHVPRLAEEDIMQGQRSSGRSSSGSIRILRRAAVVAAAALPAVGPLAWLLFPAAGVT